MTFERLLYTSLIILSAILGSFGQVMFKASEGNYFSYNFVFGLVLYGCATLIYVKALKYIPLSIAYPIIAISYALVVIFSKIFFNESVTLLKTLGTLLIILGVSLVGIGSK